MSEEIHLILTIPAELAGSRLDQALAELLPQYSRSRLQTWIRAEQVTVNGKLLRGKDKLQGNEEIEIRATLEAQTTWQPQAITLNIVHEDAALLVINKPAGLVVHPGAGNPDNTLLNALLHHQPQLATLPRAGIVHRLDKDTSGLLVIAKTLSAHTHLVNQLQTRSMKREYHAIINGSLVAGGTVDAPIGRHPKQRTKMAVVANGKPAITHYRLIKRFAAHTYIKVLLETGRTHQIRVHMAHIQHPIVGDPLYAGRLALAKNTPPELAAALRAFKRQALHAKRLTLLHPETNAEVSWAAALPEDIQTLLALLEAT